MNTSDKLAILVPDGAYPLVLSSFLSDRTQSLGLRRIDLEIVKDAFRDSSREAVELLRPFQRTCSHALIIRDLHGSGWEDKGANVLEDELKEQMIVSGWTKGQCAAVVVEPEIEAWLRFDSSHFHQLIRDRARKKVEWDQLLLRPLIDELISKRGGKNEQGKPLNPKETFEDILSYFGIQRSNALYGQLASVESLRGCSVASFNRLIEIFRDWFSDVK